MRINPFCKSIPPTRHRRYPSVHASLYPTQSSNLPAPVPARGLRAPGGINLFLRRLAFGPKPKILWTVQGDARAHCYQVLPSGQVLSNISGNKFGLFNAQGDLQWSFKYPENAYPRFFVTPTHDIIVTCNAARQQKAAYVCLALDGTIRWQFTVIDEHSDASTLPFHFRGNSPLKEIAFLQFWSHLVFAVDENGSVNWISDSLLLAPGEHIQQLHRLKNSEVSIVAIVSGPGKILRFVHIDLMGKVRKSEFQVSNVSQTFLPLPPDPLGRGFWLGFSIANGSQSALSFFSLEGEEKCRVVLGNGITLPSASQDSEGNLYYAHAFHPTLAQTLFRKINNLGEVLSEVWVPGYIQKPPAIRGDQLVIADDAHDLLWGFDTQFRKRWGPFCPYFSIFGTNLSGTTLWELGQPEFLPSGDLIYGVMGGKHAGKIFCLRPPDTQEPMVLTENAPTKKLL